MGLFTRKRNYGRFDKWPDPKQALWVGNYKAWGLGTHPQEWSHSVLAELRSVSPREMPVGRVVVEGQFLTVYVNHIKVGLIHRDNWSTFIPMIEAVGGETLCQLQLLQAQDGHWYIGAAIVDLNYLQGLNPH